MGSEQTGANNKGNSGRSLRLKFPFLGSDNILSKRSLADSCRERSVNPVLVKFRQKLGFYDNEPSGSTLAFPALYSRKQSDLHSLEKDASVGAETSVTGSIV